VEEQLHLFVSSALDVTGHDPTALPPLKDYFYPEDRRLGGLQSRSGRGGEVNNS
jgi:hypothetical protein